MSRRKATSPKNEPAGKPVPSPSEPEGHLPPTLSTDNGWPALSSAQVDRQSVDGTIDFDPSTVGSPLSSDVTVPPGPTNDVDTSSAGSIEAGDGIQATEMFVPSSGSQGSGASHESDAKGKGASGGPSSGSKRRSVEGKSFGEYDLIEEIARGGMGVVYKARQRKLNRIVAVKMILAGQFASPEHVVRFYTEAEAAAKLDHPGIVPIYEVNEQDGLHYFSMGFVDGASLAESVRSGPLSTREAAKIVRQVALAVQYAHDHGVVHRDLKPGNILMTSDGQPRVTDFGLAKSVEEESGLTASGQILGTPGFMPPEQASGRIDQTGPNSDIYSLGAVLYCLVTGRPPFQAASPVETVRQVIERDPASPRLLNPSVDRDLETICLKCLEKDSRNRYESASELADELARFLAGEPIQARRIGVASRAWRWCRRKPAVAALLFAVPLTILLAGAAAALWYSGRQTRQLARLDSEFEIALDDAEATKSSMSHMNGLVEQMQALDPVHAVQQHERMRERIGELLATAIRRVKPSEESIAELEAKLDAFDLYDASRVDQLRRDLETRLPEWRIVFDLSPQAADVDLTTVFDGGMAVRDGDAFVARSPDGRTMRVRSRAAAHGDIELSAVFDAEWRSQTELTLALNDSPRGAYRFALHGGVLRRSLTDHMVEGIPLARMDEAIREEGMLLLAIYRNDSPILRQSIPAESIQDGPLTLRARRENNVVSVQLNGGTIYSVRDPFPLSRREPGVFAIDWPDGLRITSLRAMRRAIGANSNDLERGDELYGQGEIDRALAYYEGESLNASTEAIRREALYKTGLCLMELDRPAEGLAIFEQMIVGAQDDWTPVAGCQIWLARLREKRFDDADAVFELLKAHYELGQLGALVPREMRDGILREYLKGIGDVAGLFRHDPQRVERAQRVAEIDRLLSPDGIGDTMLQIEVIRALRLAGDQEAALVLAEPLARATRNWNAIKNYARLLRQTGRADKALQEIDAAIAESQRHGGLVMGMFRVERARTLAALDRMNEARLELDALLDEIRTTVRETPAAPIPINDWIAAAFIRGFLYERDQQPTLAQGVWRECFQYVIANNPKAFDIVMSESVDVAIMGALIGELKRDNTMRMFSSMAGSNSAPVVAVIQSVASADTIHQVFVEMWRDSEGRSVAEEIAFETTSLRDRTRAPLLLAAATYFRRSAAPQGLSTRRERMLGDISELIIRRIIEEGTVSSPQAIQLALAWKGTTNLLGWQGVRGSLDDSMRAQFAYVLAMRFLSRGDVANAASFLREAQLDPAGSPMIAAEAKIDLELMEKQEAMLEIDGDLPRDANVRVLRGDELVESVAVRDAETSLRIAPGEYRIELDDPSREFVVMPAAIQVQAGRRYPLRATWRWRPAEVELSRAGLLPTPAILPEVGNWQLLPSRSFDGVYRCAWTDGGRQLVVGSGSGWLWTIDVETGQLTAGIANRTPQEFFSADAGGRMLTSGMLHGRMEAWKLPSFESAGRSNTKYGMVRLTAISSDGRYMAAPFDGEGIRVATATGRLVAKLPADTSGLVAMAFRSDGDQLAIGYDSGNERGIRIWDIPSQQPLPRLDGALESVARIAWRPAMNRLAMTDGRRMQVWNMDAPSIEYDWIVSEAGLVAAGLEWVAAGDRLSLSVYGGTAQYWVLPPRGVSSASATEAPSVPPGNPGDAIVLPGTEGNSHAWTADGERLAVTRWNEPIRIYDRAGASIRKVGAHEARLTDIVTHPNEPLVAVAGLHLGIRLIDSTGQAIEIAPRESNGSPNQPAEGRSDAPMRFSRLHWSGDGRFLAAADPSGRVWIGRWSDGRMSWIGRTDQPMVDEAWNPASAEFAAIDAQGTLRVWHFDEPSAEKQSQTSDGETREPAGEAGDDATEIAMTDNAVTEAATILFPSPFVEHPQAVVRPAILVWPTSSATNDVSRVLIADEDGVLHWVSTSDGQVNEAARVQSGRPRAIAAQPGGDVLAILTSGGTVLTTRLGAILSDGGQTVHERAHRIAWSLDGSKLMSLSFYGPFYIASWSPGDPAARNNGPASASGFVAVRSDGRVVTADGSLSVTIRSDEGVAEQTTLLTPLGYGVFSAGGKLIRATADIEEELVYMIQQENGVWLPVRPSEFHRRINESMPAWDVVP